MKPFIKKIISLVMACFCFISITACGEKECSHSYASTTTKEATCKETGIKTYTCTLCGNTYMEDIAKLTTHSYTSKITKEATCKETGVKTYTCSVCDDSYTEEIAKLTTHSYASKITKEATCKEYGIKTYTCSVCDDSYTEEIAKLTTHSYATDSQGKILTTQKKEATCTTDGLFVKTCTICGPIEEKTPKIDHSLTENGICYMCGLNCPISINMTNEQKAIASTVTSCSVRQYATINGILIGLVLETDANDTVAIPAVVDISIKNTQNAVVYSHVSEIASNAFITNGSGEYEYRIKIKHTDFSTTNYALNSIQISIINPEYFGFNPSIYIPPAIIITDETLPRTITNYNTYGITLRKVNITGIEYGWSYSIPVLYFSGEKIYDVSSSDWCIIAYKLYDMNGNLVISDFYQTPLLATGERFNRDHMSLSLNSSGFYRLELQNVTITS